MQFCIKLDPRDTIQPLIPSRKTSGNVRLNFLLVDSEGNQVDCPQYYRKAEKQYLAKLITDAGWASFRQWLEYFGHKYSKMTLAVPPHNNSQNCSNCGQKVEKSLST